MTRKLSDVERDAMELPLQVRALLVEHLLTTLDTGEDRNAEEEWLQEAEKRYHEYRAGKIARRPADQVFQQATKRLR